MCFNSYANVQECDSSSFRCVPLNGTSPAACLPRKLICDGYPDCLGEIDEESCDISDGPDDCKMCDIFIVLFLFFTSRALGLR